MHASSKNDGCGLVMLPLGEKACQCPSHCREYELSQLLVLQKETQILLHLIKFTKLHYFHHTHTQDENWNIWIDLLKAKLGICYIYNNFSQIMDEGRRGA